MYGVAGGGAVCGPIQVCAFVAPTELGFTFLTSLHSHLSIGSLFALVQALHRECFSRQIAGISIDGTIYGALQEADLFAGSYTGLSAFCTD